MDVLGAFSPRWPFPLRVHYSTIRDPFLPESRKVADNYGREQMLGSLKPHTKEKQLSLTSETSFRLYEN